LDISESNERFLETIKTFINCAVLIFSNQHKTGSKFFVAGKTRNKKAKLTIYKLVDIFRVVEQKTESWRRVHDLADALDDTQLRNGFVHAGDPSGALGGPRATAKTLQRLQQHAQTSSLHEFHQPFSETTSPNNIY